VADIVAAIASRHGERLTLKIDFLFALFYSPRFLYPRMIIDDVLSSKPCKSGLDRLFFSRSRRADSLP
jgi:hypothetical protein